MSKFRIEILHDQDCESPLDFDLAWKLYSFSNRVGPNNSNPEDLGLAPHLDEYGEPIVRNPGLRRKLAVGLAHFVSCYQHSGIQWGLRGEVHQCRWDTAQIAGLLIWEHKPGELSKDKEQRTKDARTCLAQYTAWCNGECYGFSVSEVDEDGEEIEAHDSCFGFIVADKADAIYFFEQAGACIPAGAEVEFGGDAGWLAEHYNRCIGWLDGDRKADTAQADRDADKASAALAEVVK